MVSETHTIDVTPALSVRELREHVRRLNRHLPEPAREGLDLVVTEVVTNAKRHGEPPVTLEMTALAGTTRVLVRSGGDPFRWRGRPSAKPHEGGWGLVFVDGVADRWGVRHVSGLNEVWFELDH